MDFFLEIHNGECSLGGHFCETVSTQAEKRKEKREVRIHDEEINKGECTLLIISQWQIDRQKPEGSRLCEVKH